jgi:hypothetical protein
MGQALRDQDDECLRIMAKAFQEPRAGLTNHIYWDDLDEYTRLKPEKPAASDGPPEPECSVM